MKTMLHVLLFATLSTNAPAHAQTAPAPRSVSPNASEILLSMATDSKRLRSEIRDYLLGQGSVPAADIRSGAFKLKIDKDMTSVTSRKTIITILPAASPIGFTLDPTKNPIAQYLQGANTWVYPDIGTLAGMTAAQWRTSDAAVKPMTALSNLRTYCQGQFTGTNKTKRIFWFEIFPLHIYCRSVSLLNLNSFESVIDETDVITDSDPVVPRYDAYTNAVNGLTVELALGAALLQAHIYVEANSGFKPGQASDTPAFSSASEFLKNKARCFPVDGKPFIKTVLGSFLIPFNQTTTAGSGSTPAAVTVKIKAPQSVAHPEPGYAIGSYVRYNINDRDHNINIVANNYVNQDPLNPPTGTTTSTVSYSSLLASSTTSSSTSALAVPLASIENSAIVMDNKTYKSFTFNGEGVLHFNFNVRDVHSTNSSPSCTFFCSQPPVRERSQTFIDRVSTDITRDPWFKPGS